MIDTLSDTVGYGSLESKQRVATKRGRGREGVELGLEGERGVEEERGEAEDLPSEPVEKHTGRRGGPAAPKTELRNSGPQFAQQKESQ